MPPRISTVIKETHLAKSGNLHSLSIRLNNDSIPGKQERRAMRHPFDGVNLPADDGMTRRTALGAMAAAAAGVLGLSGAASAQVATTLALGEEGAATKALNETGGAATPVTTEPFGEEAGKVTSLLAPGLEDGKAPAKNPTEAKGEDGGAGGGRLTERLGEGGATTRALGEEGGGMGRGVVPVHPDTQELKDDQFKKIWDELADKDSAKGVQACAELYGAKKVVPFLKENLKSDKLKLPQADEKTVAKLIEDLDADAFDARESAEAELAKLGAAAAAAIEKALAKSKSAEQRMRLARLLEKSKDQPALTQARRGIEVLVALRTSEAKELLETLAKGDDKEWLTQAAKKGLERAKEKLPEKKDPPKPGTPEEEVEKARREKELIERERAQEETKRRQVQEDEKRKQEQIEREKKRDK
jgi:hypothetical protein